MHNVVEETSCKETKTSSVKMASLSEENIKSLYRCRNKIERRKVLATILNCTSCDDDEDDMKTSILLDYYTESVNFASEGGYSWQQGLAVFELMKELLDSTLDQPLLQATLQFKTILQNYTTVFTAQRLTGVVDFVFSYFFNHFHLYKFVFTNERDIDKSTAHLHVETPPQDLPPLKTGMEKSEWERQQVLKQLEDQHIKNIMEKQLQLDSEVERLQLLVHEKLLLLNTEKPITTEDLNDIVKETVKMYVASAGSTIQHLIQESEENIAYEFEKTAMEQKTQGASTPSKKTRSPQSGKKKGKAAKSVKG
ncbi:uncharacterized protein C8orf74 homolog [Dendronephthya gigantea]|uniref:uncharacterized protein C8orf74 homolog n=1 Tax=Dendronephthya gigantea TaxID=151771 RepID=UPI00106B40BB|nr:uncharacterized protein C8orf74 homolog [Dendronephthya gigantea]